jgi:hypothetical protein
MKSSLFTTPMKDMTVKENIKVNLYVFGAAFGAAFVVSAASNLKNHVQHKRWLNKHTDSDTTEV